MSSAPLPPRRRRRVWECPEEAREAFDRALGFFEAAGDTKGLAEARAEIADPVAPTGARETTGLGASAAPSRLPPETISS